MRSKPASPALCLALARALRSEGERHQDAHFLRLARELERKVYAGVQLILPFPEFQQSHETANPHRPALGRGRRRGT
jgi:hypothetical protein